MKSRLLAGSLLGLALILQPVQIAQAQTLEQRLYDIGEHACNLALDGNLPDVDGGFFAYSIESAGVPDYQYCECVATEFTDGDWSDVALYEEESTEGVEHLAFSAALNMMICLPDDADDGSDVLDGDLVEEELPNEDFAYDDGDVHMCELALDGGLMIPGFNESDVLARLNSSGQSRSDLCTCAARYFAAGGEELLSSIENANNPTIVYASTMAGAIEVCL